MKLFKRQTDRRQIAFLDRAIIVAIERLPQDAVRLALHRRQLLRKLRLAHLGNQVQQAVAMQCVSFAFIPFPIVTRPGADGSESRENQDGGPEIVAVPFKEGPFGAVDIGCRSRMCGQRGILVGVRFLDSSRAGDFPGELLSDGK